MSIHITLESTSGNFYVQNSRLEIHKRSFTRFGVRLLNEIPRRNYKSLPQKEFKGEILSASPQYFGKLNIIVQKIGLAK